MRISRANNDAIKYACLKFHYAKSVPVNTIGYNVYNDNDEWCGVIAYGRGACAEIGTQYGLVIGQALELVRVALNGKQEQTSKALSLTLKQIKIYVPMCKLIVSYADVDQKHLGTIYQATNWIYIGETAKSVKKYIINGKVKHNRRVDDKKIVDENGEKKKLTIDEIRKYIDKDAKVFNSQGKRKYLYPLDKKIRKQIITLQKPYPKNEDWVKIDRNQFKKQDNV